MQFRVGKCGSCKATFKVPASFGGDKAKCKSCGTGVVSIGPVEGGEDKMEEHKPSGKRERGPSMMERLQAERAASAEAKPVPAKKPAAKVPSTEKPAKRTTSPRTPAARKAGSPSKPGGKPTRTSARRAGGTRSRRESSEGGDEDPGRGRARAQKQKSPAPMVGGILLLLIAGLAIWEPWASESDDQAASVTQTAGDTPEATPQDPGPDAEPASAGEPAPEVDSPEEPEPEPEESTKPQKVTASTPDSEVDPNEIDLNSFEALPKDPKCSDEEWVRIVGLAATMADQDSPRQANKAVTELAMIGRFAYPAMVNEFLKLDLTTYEDHRQGDYYQRAMETLLGGRNYGWKYEFDTEPNKTALFNKKVVRNYYKTGAKIAGMPNAWNDLSKNEDNTNRPDAEPEPEAESGLSNDDLDDLDF